jgi:hypothetical protein
VRSTVGTDRGDPEQLRCFEQAPGLVPPSGDCARFAEALIECCQWYVQGDPLLPDRARSAHRGDYARETGRDRQIHRSRPLAPSLIALASKAGVPRLAWSPLLLASLLSSGRRGHAGADSTRRGYRLIWRPASAEIVGEGRPWTVLTISLLSMPCR